MIRELLGRVDPQRLLAALLPLVLLAIALVLVFSTSFADLGGEPLPDLTVTHTTQPDNETIVAHVVNNGPESVRVSQVLVDEAYWNFTLLQGGEPDPSRTIGSRESAQIRIPYHWTRAWDFDVTLILSDGATFHHTITAAQPTPGFDAGLLLSFVWIGLFVGVIPVAIGMMWYPFMRRMNRRRIHAVLAFSAGVLAFLAFDAGFEAFELTERIPGAYEGSLLVVLGILGALLVVQAVSASRGDDASGLWVAYLVAVGIGLHNFAEGLAIGSSFALGRAALGAFLILGFMIHNVTEGPAVVAPVAEGRRPALHHFALLGAIAGAPVILGGWVGGLAYSPTVGAFFLAVGVGAILQVIWELYGLVDQEGRAASPLNIAGFLVGFVLMYATDLLVVI